MILRRVIEHVKAQNWTAIVIDFVIVVVGVFIGLQVANWNEARQDTMRGARYLERIHDDVRTDITTYEGRLRFWNEVYGLGRIAIRQGEAGKTDDHTNWEILRAYYQASQIAFFTSAQTTYNEMQSAGELGLIRNVQLRAALSQYYQAWERNRSIFETLPPYRERIRARMPFEIQIYIWDRCFHSDAAGQDLVDCKAPIGEAEAAAILHSLTADKELLPALRASTANLRVTIGIGRERLDSARKVARLIEGEASRS